MNHRKTYLSLLMLLFCTLQVFSQDPDKEIAPPPPSPSDYAKIYTVVEEMPRFPGCEDMNLTKQDLQKCSTKAMLEYVYENLEYPQSAIENQTEGVVVLQFVVTKNGELKDIKILRDIGDQCGLAAKRVIEKMNSEELRWIPGKQRGQIVLVKYTMPIKFKLNEAQRHY